MKTLKNNFEVKNQASSDEAILDIYGIVGDWWDELEAKDVVGAIRNITSKNIRVRIHSDGGSVFAGLAIYNALVEHPAQITSQVDALAASIASVIAMAGVVEMPENAFLMIHNPWGFVFGEADDMRKYADILDKLKGSISGVYDKKTGLGESVISEMMNAETWLTAADAKEKGFADVIIGQTEPSAAIMNSIKDYKNIPPEVAAMFNQKSGEPEKTERESDMEITLQILEEKAPDILAQIRADAVTAARPELLAEGAKNELDRVKGVIDQKIPGHGELINKLAFDGKTTGPEAAVAIVGAEKQLRISAAQNLGDDTIQPVSAAPAPEKSGPPKNGTWQDRANWEWENKPETREEFRDEKDVFLAYFKANCHGKIKSIGGGK